MALNKDTGASRKTYLSIAHGVIRHTNKTTGRVESYTSLEGTLTDIYKKSRTYNGQEGLFWYLEIQDKGEVFSLCFPYASGTFKSIINSLASDESLSSKSPLRIEPYEKNGYTKVVVYSEGIKLDWLVKEMPPVKDLTLSNGKNIKDDRERMEFIEGLVSKVKAKIDSKQH